MRSYQALLLGISLAVSSGPEIAEDRVSSANGDAGTVDLRVMTFNIRYGTARDGENVWERRRDLLFGVIRKHDPDVIGLQEALRFQIDEIRKALPEYDEVGVGRDDGDQKGEYAAILYKAGRFRLEESGTFWFSDTPEVPGSKSWGNQLPRICTWARFVEARSGTTFYLYNLHFDHQSQPSRERSAELLKQRIARRTQPGVPIVTGDFNAGEKNPATLRLLGNPPDGQAAHLPELVDTFRAIHEDAKEAGTVHSFKGGTRREKIDYILAPPWVKTEAAEILHDGDGNRYPSDHFPVFARLRIPVVRES